MLKAVSLSLIVALLSSSVASAPPPPRLAHQARAPRPVVMCARDDDRPLPHPMVRYQTAPSPVAKNVPSPMVAPPPPPPPMAERTAQDIAVTGAVMQSPSYYPTPIEDRERYAGKEVGAVLRTAEAPVSTFSVDVDTGSYSNMRRMLNDGEMPPAAAVRTEEFVNYFRYDYPRPADSTRPFSVTTDVATTPWDANSRLIRIGLKGYDVTREQRPPANLVFLVDVSGSMQSPDKLELVKSALTDLAARLGQRDTVSIVVYAGAAGEVLAPTRDKNAVMAALSCLEAGGSTAGGEGLKLAYNVARGAFIKNGINRVILCTDGDFNVGVSSDEGLKELIKKERDTGVTLTALGFGTGNLNDSMMETIADAGNGNYGYVDSAMEAHKLLDEELSSTLFTIAKDVKVQVEFNPAVIAEYRLIGYENRALREEDFANDRIDAGDIGAGHQVTAIYEVVPAGAKSWLADRRFTTATRPTGRTDEAAWLKLRYKLPNENSSRLIQQPIATAALQNARPPAGDMAFVTAVAAFGQKLRGDSHLAGYDYGRIRALAGDGGNYWRQEFGKLVSLAESRGDRAIPGQ